jgi:flagellin-like protein
MFTQIKKKNKNQRFFQSNFSSRNRKGVSPIIGYVLLVSFVLVLGVVIYNWMKTYVPQEELNCPDGTSLLIKNYSCGNGSLVLTLKNNGKFNIGGYFVYVTTTAEQELATKDLSVYISENTSRLYPTGIKLSGEYNSLKPNSEEIEEFVWDITLLENIYSVEVIPIRWQKERRVSRLISCQDSKIREVLICN